MNKLNPDWYYTEQNNFDKKLVELRYRYTKQFFKKGNILEMGPANGIMTGLITNDFKDNKIYCIDGSKEHIDSIPEKENLVKICSYFENWSPEIKFSTIIMEHILEHVNNPVQVLELARNWLEDDGVIIVGAPNAQSFHRLVAVKMGLLESIYSLNERDYKVGHQRVYDFELIEKDINKAGLKIKSKAGIFFKPLSNSQIDSTWNDDMIEGFYQLGFDFPNNAAELSCICEKK